MLKLFSFAQFWIAEVSEMSTRHVGALSLRITVRLYDFVVDTVQ